MPDVSVLPSTGNNMAAGSDSPVDRLSASQKRPRGNLSGTHPRFGGQFHTGRNIRGLVVPLHGHQCYALYHHGKVEWGLNGQPVGVITVSKSLGQPSISSRLCQPTHWS